METIHSPLCGKDNQPMKQQFLKVHDQSKHCNLCSKSEGFQWGQVSSNEWKCADDSGTTPRNGDRIFLYCEDHNYLLCSDCVQKTSKKRAAENDLRKISLSDLDMDEQPLGDLAKLTKNLVQVYNQAEKNDVHQNYMLRTESTKDYPKGRAIPDLLTVVVDKVFPIHSERNGFQFNC